MENKKIDHVKELTDQLEQGVKDFFNSGKLKDYLDTLSKFNNYSLNNLILIALQRPTATAVAGYTTWKKAFNRQVSKGEKGIKIIAPAPVKIKRLQDKLDENGNRVLSRDGQVQQEEVEVTIPKFKVVSVFDISQTEGDDIPELINPLKGDVSKYPVFFKALEQVSPVPVEFEKINGAHGYFDRSNKRIAINEGASQIQTIKTCIHEIAHAVLHGEDHKDLNKSRNLREVEAESVAYVVCKHFGVDTSDYSFGYVATWSSGKEIEELKESMETIRTTAGKLIRDIEAKFQELEQEIKKQPMVKIVWSESYDFNSGDLFCLSEADRLFKEADERSCGVEGYFKTKFELSYRFNGQDMTYEGRYDIGDGEGGLLEHIQNYHEFYLNDPYWKEYMIRSQGQKVWEEDFAERKNVIEELMPYFKMHCNLSELEGQAEKMLGSEDLTQPQTQYYEALKEYVSECRSRLNEGAYVFPNIPTQEEYVTRVDHEEIEKYKEHVREEIKKEAAAFGMSVEEYAANDYEPVHIADTKKSVLSKLRENKEDIKRDDFTTKIGDQEMKREVLR